MFALAAALMQRSNYRHTSFCLMLLLHNWLHVVQQKYIADVFSAERFLATLQRNGVLTPAFYKLEGMIKSPNILNSFHIVYFMTGTSPVNRRSVRRFVLDTPLAAVASYLPTWLKIPKFLFMMMLSSYKPKIRKEPSDYE